MRFRKYVPHVLVILLAVAIVAILWVTLFSRLGTDARHFYPPLWSYRAILRGSGKALLENIGNIVLFIPVGIIAALFLKLNIKRSLLIGFTISLIIESCQWVFWLGSFEIDDLIHNTIGTGIGAVLVVHSSIGEKIKLGNRKKSLAALVLLTILIISSGFTYHGLRWQEMKRLAALNDREDGTKNQLILNPDPVYIGNTSVGIAYNSDGSILIEGSSENRARIEIGKGRLPAGNYLFSNLYTESLNGVELYLQYFDTVEGKYKRFTRETTSEMAFTLVNAEKVRCMLVIPAKGQYHVNICPVIYQILSD